MAAQITSPLELFLDSDGTPLEDGYIYIGTQGLNAETNPITVYWDDAYSIAASQPIRTIAGYGSNGGVKSNIFVNSSYSIVIKDKNGVLVFSGDSLTDPEVAVGVADAQLRAWEAEAEALTADSYATEAEDVFVNTYSSDGDGTFTATPTTDYSSLHWAAKSALGAASVNLPTITAGTAGNHIRVNAGETGYEFTEVSSGLHTSIVTPISNVTYAAVAYKYSRQGNIVTCFGSMSLTPTAAAGTFTRLNIDLPFATTMTSIADCQGNGGLVEPSSLNTNCYIEGATSVARINLYAEHSGTTALDAQPYYFSFMYEIK